MRVCLINLNFIAQDAIGQCLIHQLRFHRRRGDAVQVYTQHPPEGIPAGLGDAVQVVEPARLLARRDPFFRDADLYVYHYPGYYELLETLKTLDKGAALFYYHNVTPPALWGAVAGLEALARGQAAVRKLAPYADWIVTVSPFNAEELARDHGCPPEHIRVLPLAVPLDAFTPGPPDPALVRRYGLEGCRTILFVGRLAGNKRVDLLVEALPLVQRAIPNARLLIVGDDRSNPAFVEIAAQLRRRAKQLGVADHVIFAGRVDDLPPYYRLADVYASASLHEGFGVPLIEAMACGVPVVASRATAHPWVVGEAGLLCEPGQAEDLAEKISQVLADDRLHGELVQRGLVRVRDFSLEQFNAGWAKIVDEATAWLTARPYRPAALPSVAELEGRRALLDLPLAEEIEQLGKAADAVLQPYTVRSAAPIVGPLIAWLRRNLTSHLREPYLDPTLRRQETFNLLVVHTLRQVSRLLERGQPPASGSTDLEARLRQLEERLDSVLEYLAAQLDRAQELDDPAARAAALAALRREIDALRQAEPPST
ncbi:MAG TPA: glycosyltransferase family 1 protein [Caldilineaceae bacterium]|nr:glycosyltransferase family 1 protein [Caldilineaceae bacterium]